MMLSSKVLEEKIRQQVKSGLLSAIFLDRDGTVNVEKGHITDPDSIELIPNAAYVLHEFSQMGFLIVIISNQSAICRGLMSIEQFEKVNETLWQFLVNSNAYYDALYYCPHEAGSLCECRKPAPGLILQAAADLQIDLASSYFIGDRLTDIEAGHRAGCKAILVLTGMGESENGKDDVNSFSIPDSVQNNLEAALEWIIKQ